MRSGLQEWIINKERGSLMPTDTMYTSRNQLSSSRAGSYHHTCKKCKFSPKLRRLGDEQCSIITERDKQMKKRMKNIHECIKDLETRFSDAENDELTISILSFFKDDKNSDDEPNHGNNNNNSDDDSDLVDLESRIRKPQTSTSSPQKSNPKNASNSEAQAKYVSRTLYVSPEKDSNNLNNYLSNCSLGKSITEDASFERSQDRQLSNESALQVHWSAFKHHASTSRISTCPRFDRDKAEVTSSGTLRGSHYKNPQLSYQNINFGDNPQKVKSKVTVIYPIFSACHRRPGEA